MTLSDLGLLFSCILIGFTLVIGINTEYTYLFMQKNTEYNLALDNALEAALINSVEVEREYQVFANKKEMVRTFYDCFTANLGVFDSKVDKQLVEKWIPLLCMVESDGFFLYIEKDDDFGEKKNWTYKTEEGELRFTLSEYVLFQYQGQLKWIEGYYEDIKEQLPKSVQWGKDRMNELRRNTIVSHIKEEMEHAIYKYNYDAKRSGFRYEIQFPVVEQEEWYRTIEGTGMFALFQGHPFGNQTLGTFNKMAFGGARRKKHASFA